VVPARAWLKELETYKKFPPLQDPASYNLDHRDQGILGRRLEILRWKAHLKRGELAKRAGISKDLVNSLEQGRAANPTLSTLLRLAEVLEVSVADLIEGIVLPHGD
jgi:DNA-binding Xre family transcriptional regulator